MATRRSSQTDEQKNADAEQEHAQKKMQRKPAAQEVTNADSDLNQQIVEFQNDDEAGDNDVSERAY